MLGSPCTIGWSDFLESKIVFNLAQGLAGVPENVDCYPKISSNIFFNKTFLDPAPGGNVLFNFFKVKNEEKLKKI